MNYVDMEPLQILATMLSDPARERDHNTIGGPPQLLKIYRSLNRVPFGVSWEIDGKQATTLLGMPVFSLSGFRYPIIDPKTLTVTNSNSFK